MTILIFIKESIADNDTFRNEFEFEMLKFEYEFNYLR